MRHVSGSAALPEGLRRCISGFTRLRDREKRRVSELTAPPQGQTWRSTEGTPLREGEKGRETGCVEPIAGENAPPLRKGHVGGYRRRSYF